MAERATIEPRLMHLLNDSQSPDPASRQLPIHTVSTHGYAYLPPIEVDTGGHRRANPAPQHIPPFCSIAEDLPSRQTARADGPYRSQAAATSAGSVLPPLQLLDDPEPLQLPALHLGYSTDTNDDAATKKRQRALTLRQDNSGPLPQPLKKQKSTQQVVPPIISGLHEPPQDAAVFPPIVGGHYDDVHGSNLNAPKDYNPVPVELPPEPASTGLLKGPDRSEKPNHGRTKGRARKPRRKWSEEETNYLLLGVQKHGFGKWTKIVEDPEYEFDDRTAGDLKDRFRTCCPPELREEFLNRKGTGTSGRGASTSSQPKTSMPIENILNANILVDASDLGERRKGPSSIASTSNDSDCGTGASKPKSRAHRKNIEDLEALGIDSFKQSDRRPRRAFTAQEDADILDGIREHGASWTRIQGDARYNLKTRRPIDLRDRIRNKYPELYKSLEKGTSASISAGRTTTKILEPSVSTAGWDAMPPGRDQHLNRASSHENMPRSLLPQLPPSSVPLDPMDSLPGWTGTPSFDTGGTPPPSITTTGEEMSISRLTHLNIGDPQNTSEHRHEYHGGFEERLTGAYGGGTTERPPAASAQAEPTYSERGEPAHEREFKPWNDHGHRPY